MFSTSLFFFSVAALSSASCIGNQEYLGSAKLVADEGIFNVDSADVNDVVLSNYDSSNLVSGPSGTAEVIEAPIKTEDFVVSAKCDRVLSNKCQCVKTFIRPKLVTSTFEVPTERRFVQTFTKPVIQKFDYTYNPPLSTGPSIPCSAPLIENVPILGNNVALPISEGVAPVAVESSYNNIVDFPATLTLENSYNSEFVPLNSVDCSRDIEITAPVVNSPCAY